MTWTELANNAPKIEHGLHPVRTFHANDVDVLLEFTWSKRRNRQFLGLQGS